MPDPDGWGPTVNPEARKTLIKALNGKRKFNYLYDFGDSWHHRIKVEKTLPAIACPQVPYCIDGANACPPEDVGAGLITRIFWRRWPTQIIQSMTQWLNGMAMFLIHQHLNASALISGSSGLRFELQGGVVRTLTT